jgi:hypothetical protein
LDYASRNRGALQYGHRQEADGKLDFLINKHFFEDDLKWIIGLRIDIDMLTDWVAAIYQHREEPHFHCLVS